ncbi:MAG: UTP--glucose-1-phosphate uridylyltransferase [Clostridia bacterium]|nr:UTP--glucose-1-phosphate uridylyltransferase [Clostridia bacterium]
MNEIEKAKEILNEYDQDHIIKIFDKINEEKQLELAKQVLSIDFHKMAELYENTKKEIEIKEKTIEPIKYLDKAKLTYQEKAKYDNLGIQAVKNGEYAVVTMAGGQGTRLGHPGPKGTFKLDVYGKGKYLFEILAENLKEANKKYGVTIPWYIMTSRENNDMTRDFLEKNNYFGYDKSCVTLFMQGELPLLNTEGKLLISKDMKIKEASDGNGGTYSSLRSSGALANMKERGVKWVFIGSVDNALLKMVDVTLLGMTIDKNYQIASKTVVKANAHERVGVFCKLNNHPKVIEYTELPEKMAEEVDDNGELKFSESHIMCNLYSIDAIEKISVEPLMYHTAFKKNSYIDEEGKEVIPEEPNSYKFESFIFDAFEFFDDIAILRGTREDDFAPVKNKEGADSPKTAKELYEKYWARQEQIEK